jgi:hypothetical protein
MEKIKIRASQTYKVIAEPKTNAAKAAGELGDTAKSYIKELYLWNTYRYKEYVMTDEMYKGLICEQDSMELVQSILGGKLRMKNTINFENDYLTGTPDVILEDCIEDVKSSFTLKTFFNSEIEPAYFWQAQSYMALTGIKKYRLIYCLVETPEKIITELKKRLWFKFDCDEENEDYQLMSKQLEYNHKDLILSIPKNDRIKIFDIDYDQSKIDFLYSQIEKGRIYYDSLKLSPSI